MINDFPQALTIAGTDSGGGAGIAADFKTMQERGVFATMVCGCRNRAKHSGGPRHTPHAGPAN